MNITDISYYSPFILLSQQSLIRTDSNFTDILTVNVALQGKAVTR
jgi:hypothetical protein